MGGGGKGGGKVQVVKYYMTVHFALCHGIVDRLRRIVIKEKDAWTGGQVGAGAIHLSDGEMFGGQTKEGGIEGVVDWQDGAFGQQVHARVAERWDKTPATMPGYGGIATACFSGEGGDNYDGFYWTANTPFIPAVAFEVTRFSRGWQDGLRAVPEEGNGWIRTEWDDIRIGVSLSNDPLVWGSGQINGARVLNAWFPDTPYTVRRTDPWGSGTPSTILRTNSNPSGAAPLIDAGVQFSAVRGPYDVDTLPAGETSWINTSAPGHNMVLEFQNMPGRYFLFEIEWVDPSNTQITLVNQNQCLYNCTAEYAGWELASLAPDGLGDGGGVGEEALANALDMNPAHIIRECLVDQTWGLGFPVSAVDDTSFAAAAQTLFNEAFGLSIIWVRQTETQAFVAEILDHIKGVLYADPSTGKFVLKLIRDDYDPDTLPVVDPSNATLRSFSRRSPAEVNNEVQVTWTQRANEEEGIVVLQDLGAIVAANGEIRSDSRDYYGVRHAKLAAKLAARDIAEMTAPLASAEVAVDRRAWAWRPGGVVKLTWPDYGADELVMRIMGVSSGRPGDSAITLNLVEDIFSFAQMDPIEAEEILAEPFGSAAETPDPVEFITAPNYLVKQQGADDPGADEAYVSILARTDVFDTESVALSVYGTDEGGSNAWLDAGTIDHAGAALLADDWSAEAQTVTGSDLVPAFETYSAGVGPTLNGFALIGPSGLPEDEQEIVLFTGYDAGEWTVTRGCLDTVPRAWSAGTAIRFFSGDSTLFDTDARPVGVEVDYRLRTRTSLGLLPTADAALPSYIPTDRFEAPARPANAKVAGTGFGLADGTGGGDITVTWSNRNRLIEETVVLAWDAATVTSEVGQTTTLTLIDDSDDSTIATITGLTGTTHDIPSASFGGADYGRVKFEAVRDGLTSIQGHEVRVRLNSGYGFGYGDSYGE